VRQLDGYLSGYRLQATCRLQLTGDRPLQLARLGLSAMLSAFNRKERLFLLGYASGGLDNLELHAPGLRLSHDFRTNLAAAIDLPVPAHAWADVDYHLSWLHAAVQCTAASPGPANSTTSPRSTTPPAKD